MGEKVDIKVITSYKDVIPFARICNQTFLELARFTETAKWVSEKIKKKDEWQFGAYKDGKLIGFLQGKGFKNENYAGIGLIGIDPAWRGKGVGSLLLKVIEDKARETGFEKIKVGTPFARGFYEKKGYVCTSIKIKMVRDISQQSVEKPADITVEALDFTRAGHIGEEFTDEQDKCDFYFSFFNNYRKFNGMFFHLKKDNETAGIILGKEHDRNSDLAEIVFYRAFRRGTPADCIRVFEYEVSRKGLRLVGLAPKNEEEPFLEELGYKRAAMDIFWTSYSLEKKLTNYTINT